MFKYKPGMITIGNDGSCSQIAYILLYLALHNCASIKEISEACTKWRGKKIRTSMYFDSFYGYLKHKRNPNSSNKRPGLFIRVSHGVYALSEYGKYEVQRLMRSTKHYE